MRLVREKAGFRSAFESLRTARPGDDLRHCLQKELAAVMPRQQDLADDLQRFLQGEPSAGTSDELAQESVASGETQA